MTTSNYTENATQVLASMNVKFSAKFLKYGFHFTGDTQCRNIYTVRFSRGGKSFSLQFGASIADPSEPSAYDVISCIQKYDLGSFEDFCMDFGYDTDSRTAERTYKAVCKEYEKVSNFFSPEEIEQLQEIQ